MIDLKVEFRQQGFIKGLDRQIDKAVRMAQRDASRKLKSAAAKYVSAQYWLTQAFVKKHISELPEGIKVSSARLSLDKYKLTPKTPRTRRHLKAAVKRSGGMKPLSPRAFIWKSHPFQRERKARLPIRKLVGPAVPQLVDKPGVIENIQREGADTFSKRLQHYISRLGGSK